MLNAPVNGKIIPNDQIADDTFAAEFLGKTVAIEPADGIITAPCDGEVVSIFETGHAVCILTDGGAELLIHIGIDTVKNGWKWIYKEKYLTAQKYTPEMC